MRIEKKLEQAIASGDIILQDEVFQEVYDTYYKLVYYLVIQIVKSKEDTEEIVNDVFLKAFRHLDQFDYKTSLKSWLAQIAKHEAINCYNKNKKQNIKLEDKAIDNLNSEDHFYQYMMEFEEVLDQEELDILVYRLYFNLKFEEISDLKDLSVSAIFKKYRSALKKIKMYYQEGDDKWKITNNNL